MSAKKKQIPRLRHRRGGRALRRYRRSGGIRSHGGRSHGQMAVAIRAMISKDANINLRLHRGNVESSARRRVQEEDSHATLYPHHARKGIDGANGPPVAPSRSRGGRPPSSQRARDGMSLDLRADWSGESDVTKVAVLDDWQRAARGCADWSKLGGRPEVTFFSEAFAGEDDAASRLADSEHSATCLRRSQAR